MDCNEILLSLRSLSFSELQSVVSVATSLLANKPPKDIPIEYLFAYQGFVYHLQLKTEVVPALGLLKRELQKEVMSALNFLLTWLKDELKLVVRRTDILPWFTLFGEILVDFLEERKVPLSLIALVRQSRSVPGLIEQSFPGYIKAGALELIIMSMRKKNDEI